MKIVMDLTEVSTAIVRGVLLESVLELVSRGRINDVQAMVDTAIRAHEGERIDKQLNLPEFEVRLG